LALSKNVILNDGELARIELSLDENDPGFYNFKLRSVLKSFPPDITQGQAWTEFPIFYEPLYDSAVAKNKTVCRITHWNPKEDDANFNKDWLDHSLEYWTNRHGTMPIVRLTNFAKFAKMCYKLKMPSKSDPPSDFEQGCLDWDEFNKNIGDITVDIDSFMFNQSSFLSETKKLYEFFKFDDYNPELLLKFYTPYLKAHGLTVNL
jgi:hypothetical protein